MNVEVLDIKKSDESFMVYADVESEEDSLRVRKNFPKEDHFFEEDEENIPKFVRLVESEAKRRIERKKPSLGKEGKNVEDYKKSY